MGVYNSGRYMGSLWTRERGYHTPPPLPSFVDQAIAASRARPKPAPAAEPVEVTPDDEQAS